MPPNASCRFGAHRSGRRPSECELGHCGIDLAGPVGTPVYAVADGVVLAAVRNEHRGGRAGRYVKLGHDGVAKTYYVHLDEVRADLRPGSLVKGGEQIGTIGLTGVKRSAPHLHFGLAVNMGRAADSEYRTRFRYVDPEPLLWFWRLPEPQIDERPLLASRAR
jgi:murein DD-endopeptidase MepM/ murein hydrolase activator NlpD